MGKKFTCSLLLFLEVDPDDKDAKCTVSIKNILTREPGMLLFIFQRSQKHCLSVFVFVLIYLSSLNSAFIFILF